MIVEKKDKSKMECLKMFFYFFLHFIEKNSLLKLLRDICLVFIYVFIILILNNLATKFYKKLQNKINVLKKGFKESKMLQ